MKKTFITLSITFFAVFTALGQSITLTPTNPNQVTIRGYGVQRPTFSGFNSSGSSEAPIATGTGRMLVGVYGYGYTGSSFTSEPNAAIELRASNNYTTSSTGSQIFFRTTSDGSTTAFDRMLITDIGRVGIGTLLPQTILEVRTPTASYGFQHGDGTVNLATYVSSQTGGWLGTRTNHPLSFYVNSGGSKLSIANTGNVTVSDFTKLGSDAPAIKQKEITGYNTAALDGTSSFVPHGLPPSKILDVAIFVEALESGDVSQIPPRFPRGEGFSYSFIIKPFFIEVYLNDGANILNKPIKVIITYKE
ncbi:hypothetical protein GVN20_17960 [Runella sp. CRIBMP]|uniref:hypothetical protein n=1 Tax=Runella sp. CRIBMP TaxID=2683261 RepID=UPI001412032B|nr:hypothetical protein [Runella sp. CRIBMP]NBB21255.1 hypothetical protein [Runella sp. CRIBMP]